MSGNITITLFDLFHQHRVWAIYRLHAIQSTLSDGLEYRFVLAKSTIINTSGIHGPLTLQSQNPSQKQGLNFDQKKIAKWRFCATCTGDDGFEGVLRTSRAMSLLQYARKLESKQSARIAYPGHVPKQQDAHFCHVQISHHQCVAWWVYSDVA